MLSMVFLFIMRLFLTSFSSIMIFIEYSRIYDLGDIGFIVTQSIGLILSFFYLYLMYIRHGSFVLSYVFQIYSFFGLLFSTVFISSGLYMFEIDGFGTANSAFWVCLLFFILGMESALVGFNHGIIVKKFVLHYPILSRSDTRSVLYFVPVVMVVWGMLIFSLYGGPFLLGVNRIYFWSVVIPEYLRPFKSVFGQSFILVAILFNFRKYYKIPALGSSFIAIMYIILTYALLGEKFSTFVFYIVVWLFILSGSRTKLDLGIRSIFVAAILTISIIFLVANVYESAGRGYDFIYTRIALQGELLWSVMNESWIFELKGGDWSCFMGCYEYNSGAKYISSLYMPYNLFNSYEDSGSGLSGFFPALPIVTFGFFISIVLHMVFSYFCGYLQRLSVLSVESRNVILTVFSFKIYYSLSLFWYTANVYVVFGGAALTAAVLAAVPLFGAALRIRSMRHKGPAGF